MGWTTEGSLPEKDKKYIIVVAPHTSNWDFMVGLWARSKLNFNPQYVAKEELFVWPIGWLFRKLGGYPVSRSHHANFVDSMVSIFEKEEEFILTITPEGTRSYQPKWKTGFFYIAQKANIPIIPVAFDYINKKVVAGPALYASGDVSAFILDMKRWFYPFKGRTPENGIREEDIGL